MGKEEKEINYIVVNLRNEKYSGFMFLSYFIFLYNFFEDIVWIVFVLCEFVGLNCGIYKKERVNFFVYICIYLSM